MSWANDFLYLLDPSDHYYTNGLDVEYIHPALEKNPLGALLLRPANGFRQRYGLRLRQDIFTPIRKDTLALLINDRPFASALTLESSAYSVRAGSGTRLESSLMLGVVGKAGGGRAVQNGIHGLLENSEGVEGWVNEIRTGLVVNYNLEVRQRLWSADWTWAELALAGRLGSLYTDLSPSATIAFGLVRDPYLGFQDPDAGRPFRLSLLLGGGARAVAYDATLTGSWFAPDPRFRGRIRPEHMQYRGRVGLMAGWKRSSLSLVWHFQSAEFQGGEPHAFGALRLAFWW